MPEEAMFENVWESDEAQDWESDEALAESDESIEDLGEAARSRRRQGRKGPYLPTRGIRGMTVRGPDGVRNVSFPAKLATTSETNRGLASQELARRGLEERLDRFEARLRGQHKNDVSATGLVTLVIGGGLTFWGAAKASEQQGFTFNSWANQGPTQVAALVSATQLATTGAKLAMSGHYSRSAFGIAADAFAVAQLAAFAFGSLSNSSSLAKSPPILLRNQDEINKPPSVNNLKLNDVVVTTDEHKTWEVVSIDRTDADKPVKYRQLVPE